MFARPTKERAANFDRVFRSDGFKRAAIKQQLDQATLNAIVRADADVLCKRFVKFCARAPLKVLQ